MRLFTNMLFLFFSVLGFASGETLMGQLLLGESEEGVIIKSDTIMVHMTYSDSAQGHLDEPLNESGDSTLRTMIEGADDLYSFALFSNEDSKIWDPVFHLEASAISTSERTYSLESESAQKEWTLVKEDGSSGPEIVGWVTLEAAFGLKDKFFLILDFPDENGTVQNKVFLGRYFEE